MRSVLYLFLILFITSCKSNAELSMERGIQYYEWGKYDEAILEFNHAKYYQLSKKKKSYNDIQLLAQTHYNLSITYAKMQLMENAMQEAQHAYNLIPSTDHRELISLLEQQLVSNNH